ncbi:diguanylate cyclase [Pseudoalteromonas sp. SWXJ133]|jgi:diguanylate cyclase (GGDEF)-like protein|uniref:GGDEF domain-containing response regulator n=1 Tax=unclassified Pseudoalteromonas TaxID=194690 RepID=UPI001407744B|nr:MULTISPECIES: diguanylate cyclase [unclassified Pseudoalteromonas]MBH0021060.1 diguanylate cyclase [Pseudoalteromonas sp. SWXJ133]
MPINYSDHQLKLSLKNSKVLVVDDQLLSLIVLKKILSEHFNVITAGSGEEAIEICNVDVPDIVLLDINMGGMSGIETCLKLKNNTETQDTPVIFVTSFENEEEECWEAGAVDFIKKPIKTETLFRRVRAHITLKLQHDLLNQKVFLDDLTQVFNRRYFDAHFNKMERSALREKVDYALLLIDIDYFKQYNDIYGHVQGDKVLNLVAQTITNSLQRPADFVARYGGEEFVVVLPHTSTEGAICVADKIKKNIIDLKILHEYSEYGFVTISIGGSTLQPYESNKNTLQIADEKMYESKMQGRNQVCF